MIKFRNKIIQAIAHFFKPSDTSHISSLFTAAARLNLKVQIQVYSQQTHLGKRRAMQQFEYLISV